MTIELLAVGNDPMLLMTRGEVLRRLGYSVTTTDSSAVLAQQFRPADFDLVILCHTLSEDERQSIAAFVRYQIPSTPVLAVSPLAAQRFEYADLTVESDPANMIEGIGQVLAESTSASRKMRQAG